MYVKAITPDAGCWRVRVDLAGDEAAAQEGAAHCVPAEEAAGLVAADDAALEGDDGDDEVEVGEVEVAHEQHHHVLDLRRRG